MMACLKRYFSIFVEEHVQLTGTYPQVTISELVRNVETKSTKLASL